MKDSENLMKAEDHIIFLNAYALVRLHRTAVPIVVPGAAFLIPTFVQDAAGLQQLTSSVMHNTHPSGVTGEFVFRAFRIFLPPAPPP